MTREISCTECVVGKFKDDLCEEKICKMFNRKGSSADFEEMITNMVEVVRCEDCRHAEHRKQMPKQVYCKRDKLTTFCVVHDDDDFCKYGERRES